MKEFLFLLLCAACLAGLSACNTVQGVGEDVSVVGEKISTGAERVERRMEN